MAIVLLARHGESDWNRELRWQGHADRPLTERGQAQARALAARLAHVPLAAVYASDLIRARETARAVAEAKALPLILRPDLREVDVGTWSGLTRAETEARFPEGFRHWRAGGIGWDGGETYEAMAERSISAVCQIAVAHGEDQVLIVTHGGPIRALHAFALGMRFATHRRRVPVEPNARLSALAVESRSFRRIDLP